MPPKKDLKPQKGLKQGVPLKDLIPANLKQPPREARPPKSSDPHPPDKRPEFKSLPLPGEWPGDEQAKNFDFGLENQMKFLDNTQIRAPQSFSLTSSQITFWRRPKEFLLDELDDNKNEIGGRRGSNPIVKSKFKTMSTVSYDSRKDNDKESLHIEDDIRVHSPKKRAKDLIFNIKVFCLNISIYNE